MQNLNEPTTPATQQLALVLCALATGIACSFSRPSLEDYSRDYGRSNGGGGVSTTAGDSGKTSDGGTGIVGGSGSSGAPADCAISGTELCESFESGNVDPRTWHMPVPSTGATMVVDDSRVHSGKYALHIVAVPGKLNTASIDETVTFPADQNRFYTRMFIYLAPDLPTAAPNQTLKAMFFIAYGKNAAGNVDSGVGIGLNGKQFLTYSIFRGDPFWQFGPGSDVDAKANEWSCLEVLEDGSNPETETRRVWLNDQEFVQLASDSAESAGAANPNHTAPTFADVALGLIELFPTPTLTDVWIDDIRVSSKRIGCGSFP